MPQPPILLLSVCTRPEEEENKQHNERRTEPGQIFFVVFNNDSDEIGMRQNIAHRPQSEDPAKKQRETLTNGYQ